MTGLAREWWQLSRTVMGAGLCAAHTHLLLFQLAHNMRSLLRRLCIHHWFCMINLGRNDRRTARTTALAIARPQLKKPTHSLSMFAEGRVVPSLLQEFVPTRMDRLVALVHRACFDWSKPTVDPLNSFQKARQPFGITFCVVMTPN